MLTLGLALVVLGLIGLVLAAVRRAWPAVMPWRRILLVQLLVLAAWVVGGNLLAAFREGRVERAWKALDPSAAAPAPVASSAKNAAALELVRLASGMGIDVGRDRAAGAVAPEPAMQAAMATLGTFADTAFRQADDRLSPATAELRAWLVLQDEKLRELQKQLLDGGPVDWGALEDDRLPYSSLELRTLHAALVASALERTRSGDASGASTALEAASRLSASLRDRRDTVSRMLALAQDRRVLGALRMLDPVPAGFERLLDEIEEHTRPLAEHARESLALLAEARKPYTTLRGLILETDTESVLLEHRRPRLTGLWLALSGGTVSADGWGDAVLAERRRTGTPFYRYVQGPLEKPFVRLVVARSVAAQVLEAAAAAGVDPCGDAPVAPPASQGRGPSGEGLFVERLARLTAAMRAELELTRLVERARFLRALSPKREWPAELRSVDSRACAGRRFVARFEGNVAEIGLEPNPFGEKEASVTFRMTGR